MVARALFSRVIAALDATYESEGVLATAVEAAAMLRSSLTGLFVEDTDLLNMAALPFAREVRLHSTGTHAISRDRIEGDLHTRAAMARHTLETLTRERRLSWNFDVVRSRTHTALCGSCGQTDLIAVGRVHPKPGELMSLADQAPAGAVLVSGTRPVPLSPLIVPYAGGAADDRALETAARVAAIAETPIDILIHGHTAAELDAAERRAREIAAGSRFSMQRLRAAGGNALMERLTACRRGMIVVHRRGSLGTGALDRIVSDSVCPLLILREGT